MKRTLTDERGVTLTEICVAIMIMSVGLASILALFPRALNSTKELIETSAASSVARSAMAQIINDALDGQIGDVVDEGVEWAGGHGADGAWPAAILTSGEVYTGTVQALGASSLTVSDIGGVGTWGTIGSHFLLMRSGRARGTVFPITGSSIVAGNDSITIGADPDAAPHSIKLGDEFEIIGPGCIGPVEGMADGADRLYSWIAVVSGSGCQAGTGSAVSKLHKVHVFVYGKEYSAEDFTLAGIKDYRPAFYFTGAIAQSGD